MSSIAENLARVKDAVATACRKAGRRREDVQLMAVSKTHPVEALLEAAAAGQTLFGENRVQEFARKMQALVASPYSINLGSSSAVLARANIKDSERNAPASGEGSKESRHAERSEGSVFGFAQNESRFVTGSLVDLSRPVSTNLIGHLQSNKAAQAAEIFTAIDTLDSLKLAERLHSAAQRLGRALPVLLEIKLSPEVTKQGLAPDSAELAQLLERLRDLARHLPLRGLMTVAPIADDPAIARACFRELHVLRDRLAQQHPRLSFDELSMGMSGDFEAAIEEGSTIVRIGTAIFGARPRPETMLPR